MMFSIEHKVFKICCNVEADAQSVGVGACRGIGLIDGFDEDAPNGLEFSSEQVMEQPKVGLKIGITLGHVKSK